MCEKLPKYKNKHENFQQIFSRFIYLHSKHVVILLFLYIYIYFYFSRQNDTKLQIDVLLLL